MIKITTVSQISIFDILTLFF